MSAPKVEIQSKGKDKWLEIPRAREASAMRLAKRVEKVKEWLSWSFAAVTPWRVGRLLALTGLLAIGTGLYFNMASGGEAGSPSSISTAEGVQTLPENDPYAYLTTEEFTRWVAHDKVDDPSTSMADTGALPKDDPYADLTLEEFGEGLKRSNHDAFLIERLERQIDSRLADATRDPTRVSPRLNREIEHLDAQIDMLQAASTIAPPTGKPRFSQDIERLEGEIKAMLFEAAHNPSTDKARLSWEIGRLDDQIDVLRLASIVER